MGIGRLQLAELLSHHPGPDADVVVGRGTVGKPHIGHEATKLLSGSLPPEKMPASK